MFRPHYFAAALVAFCSFATLANAQETKTENTTPAPVKMTLDTDGNLVGKVFADVDGEKKPVEAKLTLIREGVTVKSVYADEQGSFSFGNVAPGKYAVSGSAASYVGMSPVAVVAPVAPAPTPTANSFVLSSPSYGSYAPSASCSSCSGGYGGGGGFGGGRFLGGNRRLLKLGLIGGIVGIAVSGDDDEDMSPVQ